MAAKPFWTSFFDGLTGEGIFSDLRLPGSPTRLFKPEPQLDHPDEIRASGEIDQNDRRSDSNA